MVANRKQPELISTERLPHTALRKTEVYLRKQTFRVEDAGVTRLLALYRAAYRDLRDALDAAGRASGTLTPYFAQRIAQLRADVQALLEKLTRTAQAGGYYGRLWQLDTTTRPDVRVQTPPDVTRFDMLPTAVVVALALEMDDLLLRLRRAVSPGLTAEEKNAARAIRVALGVETKNGQVSGSFARTNTLTRTLVQSSAEKGGINAFYANAPLIQQVEWVTQRDERVCPYCFPLDGKRFTLPLPLGMRPPPAHPHCRCHLVPLPKADVIVPPDEPPRQSLEVWSQYNGAALELTLFLEPKYI